MKDLSQLQLKHVYRTGDDDLFHDFYNPVLKMARTYDRAVGYFSSNILSNNIQGLASLIKNDGKMRLVIGHPLEPQEYDALKNISGSGEELASKYAERLMRWITDGEDLTSKRLEILATLVASNRLEIKFAFRKAGMYHEKIGIVRDLEENIVVFQGSANETPSGLYEHLNAESLSVYKSWESETFSSYGDRYIEGFERLWNNQQKQTYVVSIQSDLYQKRMAKHLEEKVAQKQISHFDLEGIEDEIADLDNTRFNSSGLKEPQIPKYLNGHEFRIKDHQREALQDWMASDYSGILQLATGSGKTITSIFGAVKIYESMKKTTAKGLCLVVAVPYVALANQWVENLGDFGITPYKCYNAKSTWVTSLTDAVVAFSAKSISFLPIVVVNNTLLSDEFQKLINMIGSKRLMFVGDECHNHGSDNTSACLPDAKFRMGLSATPYRTDSDEYENPFPSSAKDNLTNYYGRIVAQYSLGDAIHDGILTPYDYHVVPVYLNAEEQEGYEEISEKITSILSKTSGKLSPQQSSLLTLYCGQRSRLLGSASNKLVELRKLTKNVSDTDKKLSLFYAGEGASSHNDEDEENEAVINKVSRVLYENGWKTSQFTASVKAHQRQSMMETFKDTSVDALVAMKILDEGIDVPACKTAYILASTRNPRQYIQRRGRVLRKFTNKDRATIYDFVVLPMGNFNHPTSKKLIASELERIHDFLLLADNKLQVKTKLKEIGIAYDITG